MNIFKRPIAYLTHRKISTVMNGSINGERLKLVKLINLFRETDSDEKNN